MTVSNPACSGLASLAADARGYADNGSSSRAMTFQKPRVPCRGQVIRRAGRVDRRPLRHLQGARPRFLRPHHAFLALHLLIYTVHAGAFPVRALPAFGVFRGFRFVEMAQVHLSPLLRSDRRGSPRPCSLSMPWAQSPRPPLGFLPSRGSGVTARVRRPTLNTLPSATHPRSQFTLPTALQDRSRPHNQRLQQTGTRLLIGAAAPASTRQQLNRIR